LFETSYTVAMSFERLEGTINSMRFLSLCWLRFFFVGGWQRVFLFMEKYRVRLWRWEHFVDRREILI